MRSGVDFLLHPVQSNLLRAVFERVGQNGHVGTVSDHVQPIRVEIIERQTALLVAWPDGVADRFDAVSLRRASRAASEIRRQADGIALIISPDLHVTAAEEIGNYALRLHFSDGHNRGIYPWTYLRELAAQQAA